MAPAQDGRELSGQSHNECVTPLLGDGLSGWHLQKPPSTCLEEALVAGLLQASFSLTERQKAGRDGDTLRRFLQGKVLVPALIIDSSRPLHRDSASAERTVHSPRASIPS